jgi:hypothetical protein
MDGGHVSGISSIPVITCARASSSFGLQSKAQRCLIYTECSYHDPKTQSKNVNSRNISLNIFHQISED